MKNKSFLIIAFIFFNVIYGCSKKATPHAAVIPETNIPKKTTIVVKAKLPVAQVIVVSDSVAQKTVDGRFYYDLNGKRYWRSNKDGKYYLFNKSMYNNPDFKKKGE